MLNQMTKYINKNNIYYFIGTIVTLVIFDLLSKYYIFEYLKQLPNNQLEILPIFNLVMVWNRGVSFGMLNNLPYAPVILTLLALFIVGFLINWLINAESKSSAIALTLIIAGAFGNIIDRIINGAVADFLDFHIGYYHWPAFNLADSLISVGAIALILEEIILQIKKWQKKS